MRNYSQMQVKRIRGLPLAVRGCPSLYFWRKEVLKSFTSTFQPSIFQIPEIVAIEILTIWVSSQNNPLWKTNKIMLKNFLLSLSSCIGTNIFFFLVFHFIVSKMEYVILVFEGNGLISPIASSNFLAQKNGPDCQWVQCGAGQATRLGLAWKYHFAGIQISDWLVKLFINQNKIAG